MYHSSQCWFCCTFPRLQTGKLWGKRPIWIDGEVKGTIDIGSEVIIGESAKIDATIRASTIKVNGFVEGELYASGKIEIMSKGVRSEERRVGKECRSRWSPYH